MDSMVDSKEENQSKISQNRKFWREKWEADVLPLNYSRSLLPGCPIHSGLLSIRPQGQPQTVSLSE
jgi:hypothetical protein